ncbi:glyoxalase-like domain protein [Leptospira noguchii str. 1993005606]|uniref:Glyoxalase-like domain protein n=2 Tax=Leptospira noguchii TaxID=28182 RepID=M6Y2P4_9LEPT|nr:VOC family protein [Leptospira noguchii]EMM98386.1 glyoxalase-like domain protein [Leptospira noguchii str. 2007001578]EMO88582.1 glyoxalase-like domain protein [Leptospira noguchii str. 2001034031]EPE84348.1 glyoxalase-like domain protein [Leptospira noguchii str. 1993005606]
MQPRMNLITLGVRDLEKAVHFYEQGLGFPKMKFEGNVAFFMLNGTWLALYPWEELAADVGVSAEGDGFRGFTIAYNGRSKEEVDQVIAKAEKVGAKIVKRPQNVFWGGYSGYFQDPEGFYWEVAWNPGFYPGPS